MESKYVNTQPYGEVLLITIQREEKLNALNRQVIEELRVAIAAADDDPAIAAVIITGAGTRAFVAGADIAEFSGLDAEGASGLARTNQEAVFNRIGNMGKPVIAAINGFALGGGLELALACHVRIASEHAKLGLPEVSLGLIPGYGGTQRLAQLAGKGKALEMILTAEHITAEDALRHGIVNRVVPPEKLLVSAIELVNRMIHHSPEALAAAIRAVNAGYTDEGFAAEIGEFGAVFTTENAQEGIAAFTAKRKPQFKRS
ncbi:MAG: enoyl-CoA hydratase/isomerase family protein [Mucilaginibacter polytrichastri]|nr:enoyl-CoA hydratase/isomerase family protein [Mucilaginibacter polytrichastri]